jgi:hypothetical protein
MCETNKKYSTLVSLSIRPLRSWLYYHPPCVLSYWNAYNDLQVGFPFVLQYKVEMTLLL